MGLAAPGADQPAGLADEPMLATKGGNAASGHRATMQKRKWQGQALTTQAADAGSSTSL